MHLISHLMLIKFVSLCPCLVDFLLLMFFVFEKYVSFFCTQIVEVFICHTRKT